jgi:hypothetical protein
MATLETPDDKFINFLSIYAYSNRRITKKYLIICNLYVFY